MPGGYGLDAHRALCKDAWTKAPASTDGSIKMRIDVILESNAAPEIVAELGTLAETCGLGGVWVSNMNDGRDPFINFVDLARSTERIRLGPIAVSPFELHPLKMAAALLTLNEVSTGRAQIVVGAGGGTATAMGVPQQRPVRAVRECVEILQAASTGKPLQYRSHGVGDTTQPGETEGVLGE